MAKRRVSRKNVRSSRRARSNLKIEMSGNLSKKDRDDLSKLKCHMKHKMSGCGSAVYCLGFLGALVYYVTTAPSIWAAVLGVIKAILWPAFLVYSAMMSLGM